MKTHVLLGLLTVALSQAVYPWEFDLNKIIKAKDAVTKTVDASREIGEPEEIQMGADLAATLLGAAPLAADEALQAYVNRVGVWLALHTERPNLPWRFGVIEHPNVNAFTTPGGYVLITRGMFDRFRNEGELAGVLAHEIAHVLQKHHLKAIQKSNLGGLAGDVADMYKANTGSRKAENVAKLVGGFKEVILRGLDKDDEFEADRMGVVIAARAGYNPYGLVGVLQTLAASKMEEPGLALMFKTHPAPNARLDQLESVMGEKLEAYAEGADELGRFKTVGKTR